MGFAENVGVVVNMKDRMSASDDEYERWLRENGDNRCFGQAVPRSNALQDAARFSTVQRSYMAKYPGDAGKSMRELAKELLTRMEASNAAIKPAPAAAAASPAVAQPPAAPAAAATAATS